MLAYLGRTPSTTKGFTSGAAGVRSDASLLHHGAPHQTKNEYICICLSLACMSAWQVSLLLGPRQKARLSVCGPAQRESAAERRVSPSGQPVPLTRPGPDQLLTSDEL